MTRKRKHNLENRVLEEEGDEFGAITAQLSGSEYAILQNQAEKELRKLLAKEESHRTHQTYIHYKIPEYQRRIESDRMKAETLQNNIDLLQSLPEERTITINGRELKGKDGLVKACQRDNDFLKELVERAKTLGTESEHTVKFNIAGKIDGYITRRIYQAMTDSRGTMSVMVDTKVTIPGITSNRDLHSRWLKADINEILDFLTPDRFIRLRDEALNDIAECEKSIETLRKDEGKPFEGKERIVELKRLVEEYTEKLQADLEAKEKKYAEMDKEVTDLDDITFTAEDDAEEEEDTPHKANSAPLFRCAESSEDFDKMQERAVSERGYAVDGLAEKEIGVVNLFRHDFNGSHPISQAKEWAKENLVGTHTLTDSEGEEIEYEISNRTVNKYLSASAVDKSENLGVHLSVLKALPEVIAESVEAEVHPDYLKGFDGKRDPANGYNPDTLVHRFYGAVRIDGGLFV